MNIDQFDSNNILGAITVVLVVAIIISGMTTCSEQSNNLKKVCMELGGTVIPSGDTNFRCENPKIKLPSGLKLTP